MFEVLVVPIRESLIAHHELYSLRCKAEMWEEICANALIVAGFGSNWQPDNNHTVEVDHITECGLRISNKSGVLNTKNNTLKFSGSRLTSHTTLEDKIAFISRRKSDFIFLLASDTRESKNYNKPQLYYFCVIDMSKIDYVNANWKITINNKTGNVSSYQCVGEGLTANISRSMSDQLWTTVDLSLISEMHEIIV